MKKLFGIFICAILAAIMSAAVYADGISIEIMGQRLYTENEPQIVDGRTMVPVRAIFEGIGANVEWDSDTKTITGTMADNIVVMQIDNSKFSINGSEKYMDASPQIIDGRTYAPARYVAEAFGFNVEWDSANKIVKIGMPKQTVSVTAAESTTEITTETTTETTTEAATEVTTQAYDKYSQKYSGTQLSVGSDVPAGNYVVIPDNGKFVSVSVFKYGDTTNANGRKDIYSSTSEYRDVINISENCYITVSNGVIVPENEVEKADITRNGKFRVGTDIPAGHYTFRLDPGSLTGYVDVRSLAANSNLTVYKLNENRTEITIKLDKGTVVKKYGVDIYDSSLKMYADYSPESTVKTTASADMTFDDIRDSYKSNIDKELTAYLKNYSVGSKSGSKYSKNYVDNKIAEWKNAATNSSEKKYAEVAANMLNRLYDFACWANIELSEYSYVNIGQTKMTGGEFKKAVEADRDMYNKYARDFTAAQNFEQLETVYYNLRCLFYNVPKGQGWGSDK